MTTIENTKNLIKYGSSTYVLLCYLKMKRQAVSVSDFHKFTLRNSRPSSIQRSFDVLVRCGLVDQLVDGRIVINGSGFNYLNQIARKAHKNDFSDKD